MSFRYKFSTVVKKLGEREVVQGSLKHTLPGEQESGTPGNLIGETDVMGRTLIPFLMLLMAGIPLAYADSGTEMTKVSLAEASRQALENNHRRPASQFAVAMAEAQHRQAMAGYWPQVKATGGYELRDEPANFLYPPNVISLPNGGTVDINFGPMKVPANQIAVPGQDIKLMDRESFRASLEATWLLYDGGMRKGWGEQTSGMVAMMKEEARRTDLEIVDTVKRYYYGAVLADMLLQLGNDTLERMETTLDLTESLYKEGSGTVKKTDWLDTKVMVESLRSMVAELEKNQLLARAALANVMGLPWQESVAPTDTDLLYLPFGGDLDQLVSTSYSFSPDWAKLEAAIQAADGALRTAKSGYYPKVAVTGEVHKLWNDWEAGMTTEENKEGWTVGMGIELPLFNGFLTTGKVAEAKARVARLKEQQILLREGLGLQLRQAVVSLQAVEKSYEATRSAMDNAVENQSLNTRAYQYGLVETEKVVRAQLLEALMSARHYKICYDHLQLQSRINVIVGTGWQELAKEQ